MALIKPLGVKKILWLLKIGRLDSVEWNGGLEWWNGGMEWNGYKLDTSDWFSPSYNEHLWTKTTC